MRFLIVLALSVSLLGCGYNIRGNHSAALEKEGVHKIYVSSVVNNTYRYGVENTLYNSMIKALAAFKGFTLVSDPAEADAMLASTITGADSSISATTSANSLNPANLAMPSVFQSVYVAVEYTANLTCKFSLILRAPKRGQNAIVWTGIFSRSKPYPSSNQLGVLGTTSPLINDSEFNRTMVDISYAMAQDMREAMLSRF